MKWYVPYLILCSAGLVAVSVIIKRADAKISAIHAQETVSAPAVVSVTDVAREYEQLNDLADRLNAEADEVLRQNQAEAQAARIQEALRAVAIDNPPAPVTGHAPHGVVRGRIYSNENLKRDNGPARMIVDFSPSAAASLGWEAAGKNGHCAAFSFVEAGKRVNRLFCEPVFSRR